MSLRRIIACIAVCTLWAYGLNAQSVKSYPSSELREWVHQLKKIEAPPLDEQSSSWTLFEDQVGKAYYIDFDSFNLNLKEVRIKNIQGDVIYSQKVYDLPVDAIYELDFSQYPSGYYTIEVHSFISVFKKPIELF